MDINGVEVEDTYAEAFTSFYSRFLITASTEKWARIAATEATGYGTSMIGCSAEAGIEAFVPPTDTPDNRPGYIVQVWTSKKKMKDELLGRIGQCVLTAPTASVFNMCDSEDTLDIGHMMRFFGDGHETEREVGDRQCAVIPVMMGEFIIEKSLGVAKGVAGGNFFIMATDQEAALSAAEAAVEAIVGVDGAITPFPGGICGAGSKVGSKYKFMHASINEKMCPTLKDKVATELPEDVGAVSELVIDGSTEDAVKKATQIGIKAAAGVDGVKKITAGNYDGTLGNVMIHLKDLF